MLQLQQTKKILTKNIRTLNLGCCLGVCSQHFLKSLTIVALGGGQGGGVEGGGAGGQGCRKWRDGLEN